MTALTFLPLQGSEELLRRLDLVGAHDNAKLELAGVIVNRVERTVEHESSVSRHTVR